MRFSTAALRFVFFATILLISHWSTCGLLADEPTLSSQIAKVSMFKNGLALIERRATPTAKGVYQLDEAPEPVHGTMWVEGDRRLIARVAVREREQAPQSPNDLQKDYAGRQVTVFLQDVPQAIKGTVRKFETIKTTETVIRGSYRPPSPVSNTRFLVLDVANGEAVLDVSRIVYLEAEGKSTGTKRDQPVLLLEVGDEAVGREVRIRYLTRGISWAPSYHVDLLTPKRLRIGQTALVRNELTDIRRAEMQLISGFPNIRFRHVTSPLAPQANWTQFFSQLNQDPSQVGGALGNNIVRQQIAFNSVAPTATGIDLSATPSGDGVDLHYQSLGQRNLGNGEALQLEVASAEADYRRIVEWIVPDTHDAYGNRVDHHRGNKEEGVGEPWDALQFRNPLPMPMTTGPATITADGRFNGQTISYWVNRGEMNTLKVTKALSVRALAVENEKQGGREGIYVGGRHYVRVDVEGRLSVNNHRAEAVDLVIRRRFSGDLLRADADPQTTLLEEGAYSVNRRNELIWKMKLEPGKATELKYEYRLLVRR